jgi:hypothetical protein
MWETDFFALVAKQPQGRKSFKSFGGTQRGRGMAHSPAEKEICAGLNR